MVRFHGLAGVALVGAALGCGGSGRVSSADARLAADQFDAIPFDAPAGKTLPDVAVAMIHGAGAKKEKITGAVAFTQTPEGIRVAGDIDGLTPGPHGFHVHEKADLSDPELKGAGGHFNPGGAHHGGPDSQPHHAGDLGNIDADAKGHAHFDVVIKGLSIKGEKDGIVGRSVIVHANADDLKTDPAGASGARVAGGVIEAKPVENDAREGKPQASR